MKKLLLLIPMLIFGLMAFEAQSQQLVYRPQNPAFGGDTFNYQWLLSSAEAQNTTRDPNDLSNDPFGFQQDPLQDFSETLNRQILSRLARDIVDRQFGEDEIGEGSYDLGDFQIEINNSGSGLNITITDVLSGATTNIEVPFF
ncbi:curli production assembly/transport component CsgF [Algoriphagus hitonicola]|nr:curli production assembly/transport component CsgF [Algoriphagus hitonicola]